jgi:hypothetical protein
LAAIPFISSCFAGGPTQEGREVSFRKAAQAQDRQADLIDLLLDADEPTRKLILLQALQAGVVKKSEAEEMIAQVERLERVAGPRTTKVAAQAA